MKVLHIIVVLSIASNFSLQSMNIVPRKITHSNVAYKTRSLNIKKVKEFCNLNTFAIASNIVNATLTYNPLYLFPIISQSLHQYSTHLHLQKKSPTQFEQAWKLLLKEKPLIRINLKIIRQITQKIKALQEDAAMPESNGLNLRDYEKEINYFEKNRIKEELNVLEDISPLPQGDRLMTYIQEYENNLKQQPKIQLVNNCGLVTSTVSLVPLYAPFICWAFIFAMFNDYPIYYESPLREFIAWDLLNTIAIQKNCFSLAGKVDHLDEEETYLKDMLEILKIYQKHMDVQNNQPSQINE